MINHVWGLLFHPTTEWVDIDREGETIGHLYSHHVLAMALVPVISAYIGTTQFGWQLGDRHVEQVGMGTALLLGVLFYAVILGAIWVMGAVIHALAERSPQRPDLRRCVVFAGYVATPLLLGSVVLLYPLIWLCLLVGTLALFYSGYLLYIGIPAFLQIPRREGFLLSTGTLGIGMLVLEVLLALTVVIWTLGSNYGIGHLLLR